MALWISKLINALCQPLIKRIVTELRPQFNQELHEIAELRRITEHAILPLVLKNEIEHLQQLPLSFLREQKDLVFVGYESNELQGNFESSRSLIPPVRNEAELGCNCLVFLDEYHFVTLIRELPTLFVPVHYAITLPFRGDYLPETRIRQILHQLGFPEVLIMDYEKLTDTYSISGISNPIPINSLPAMLTPVAKSENTTRWLVANRYPAHP